MNNKGFTLIEIIGVIAILAILGVVTIPIITGVLSDRIDKIDENQKKLIIGAARSYAIKHAFEITGNDCVDVSKLQKEGFLEFTDEQADNFTSYSVTIKKDDSKYNYELNKNSCS